MFAMHFLASRQQFGYYVCTGQDPSEDYTKPMKVYAVGEIFTLILHIVVTLKIHLFKKKRSLVDENVQHDNQKSISNFKINHIINIYLFTTLLNMLKLSATKPEDLHKYPNYLFVYYRSLAMPGVGSILLFSILFQRVKLLEN